MIKTLMTIRLVGDSATIEMDEEIYKDKEMLELLSILLGRQRMIVDNALRILIASEQGEKP